METVIALGIVALLLTSFLAVFGPAATNVQRAVNAEEAERLSSGLEAEMNTLRSTDQNASGTAYNTAFEKAFDWVALDKENGSELILIYKYRADSTQASNAAGDSYIPAYVVNTDDFTKPDEIKKQPIIIQSAIREITDAISSDQLDAVDGPIFAVQLTQLVYDAEGSLVEPPDAITNYAAGAIYDPQNHTSFSQPNNPDGPNGIYPEAAIAFNAKFYLLQTNDPNYIATLSGFDEDSDPSLEETLGSPVFTRNFAIRR